MRQIILAIVLFGVLAFPQTGHSSVRIELSNSSSFVVNQYWEADGLVCFYFRNGVVGLPKDSVLGIYESDVPYAIEPEISHTNASPAAAASSHGPSTSPADDLKLDEEKEEKPFDLAQCEKKNNRLKTELMASLAQMRKASKDRDGEAKRKAKEEVRRLSQSIYSLTDEVEAHTGSLPVDWWEGTRGI